MSEREEGQGALTALEWGVKKYWEKKSDAELAVGLKTTIEEVKKMREELGLERPKGTESFKEFARRFLQEMPELEKRQFVKTLDPEFLVKIAEGNPASTGELTVSTEPIQINITQQLLKVYGPPPGTIPAEVLTAGKSRRLPARSGREVHK